MMVTRVLRTRAGRSAFRAAARVARGLHFRLAAESDFAAVCRFRHQVYAAEGYIAADAYPDGMFRDKYDSASVNAIALRRGVIVGCARATRYSALGLPTLEYFNLELPDGCEPAAMAEMGRFMVAPRYRGRARIVTLGLVVTLKEYLEQQPEIRWLVAFLSDRVRRAFAPFVPFTVLPERPLQPHHVAARALLPGYWERAAIRPVIAPAASLLAEPASVPP